MANPGVWFGVYDFSTGRNYCTACKISIIRPIVWVAHEGRSAPPPFPSRHVRLSIPLYDEVRVALFSFFVCWILVKGALSRDQDKQRKLSITVF
jgi:hypothetical protein